MVDRHDFVRVRAGAAGVIIPATADPERLRRVAAWIGGGRPLVVRQQLVSSSPRTVPGRAAPAAECEQRIALGISLPLAQSKARVALSVPRCSVDSAGPPPALTDVVAGLPQRWQPPLAALCRQAAAEGIAFRVFGSAAWQALTGLSYVDASSDIDLLWRPATRRQLAAGVRLLEAWERASGIRADGEILFGADAVAWREWLQRDRHARVLVKRLDGTSLRTARELLAALAHDGADSSR